MKATLQPPMSIHPSVHPLPKPPNSLKSIIPHPSKVGPRFNFFFRKLFQMRISKNPINSSDCDNHNSNSTSKRSRGSEIKS